MGTSVSSFYYMKKGFMKWKICIPAVFGAIAGSWMGSHLALLISESVLEDCHADRAADNFVLCSEEQRA